MDELKAKSKLNVQKHHVDVYVHYVHGDPVEKILSEILSNQFLILKNQNKMALTLADFQILFDRINTATNGIAAKITALEQAVKDLGLPAEDEAKILSFTDGLAAQLEAMAAPAPTE